MSEHNASEAKPSDNRIADAVALGVPAYYFNGFCTAMTAGDIVTTIELNGRPLATLNMSYTVAKTYALAIGQSIALLEEAAKREMLTTHEIESMFMVKKEDENEAISPASDEDKNGSET